MTYQGDEALGNLLEQAGSPYAAAEARDLIEGVMAAPVGPDADAWTALIGIGEELQRQLKALRQEMEPDGDGRCR